MPYLIPIDEVRPLAGVVAPATRDLSLAEFALQFRDTAEEIGVAKRTGQSAPYYVPTRPVYKFEQDENMASLFKLPDGLYVWDGVAFHETFAWHGEHRFSALAERFRHLAAIAAKDRTLSVRQRTAASNALLMCAKDVDATVAWEPRSISRVEPSERPATIVPPGV